MFGLPGFLGLWGLDSFAMAQNVGCSANGVKMQVLRLRASLSAQDDNSVEVQADRILFLELFLWGASKNKY